MTRDRARRMVETIIQARLDMHGADLDQRGREAIQNTIVDIQGLIDEIYEDESDASADRSVDTEDDR